MNIHPSGWRQTNFPAFLCSYEGESDTSGGDACRDGQLILSLSPLQGDFFIALALGVLMKGWKIQGYFVFQALGFSHRFSSHTCSNCRILIFSSSLPCSSVDSSSFIPLTGYGFLDPTNITLNENAPGHHTRYADSESQEHQILLLEDVHRLV